MIETGLRVRLLNPGPVTLTERVRNALAGPDLCHRESEFGELMGDVRRRLKCVYGDGADDYVAVLLTGSGTAAVEAMVSSLVPRDGRALVVANGVYGERIADILEIQNKAAEVVRSDWIDPIDLTAVEARLASPDRFSHVLAVHHETTTGRLNDLPALGAICRRHAVPLLLDTVSSFGAEAIEFSDWNLEACAATANKCLHGAPGASFVLVRKDVMEQRRSFATSIYLDLFNNYRAQCNGSPLFTPAVPSLYALQEALVELEEGGGWRSRRARYRHLSERVRTALCELGVPPLLDNPAAYSASLSSYRLPKGVKFDRLHAHLKRSDFIIYAGQLSLYDVMFRIAVMGDLKEEDIDELIERLGHFFS